ncbi:hypothetical protein GGU10DRAFT_365948 [Lentinula aff. detonsa]|uniref:Uncharacterized protein n=1 Tax=Lentinula aff. detonsa TaxID=2804958 RepID=A0AA38KLH4_9AGAR|nr:hypothetical protein GGU10DRAFT_365948 [Lentinula aff. detonsa]
MAKSAWILRGGVARQKVPTANLRQNRKRMTRIMAVILEMEKKSVKTSLVRMRMRMRMRMMPRVEGIPTLILLPSQKVQSEKIPDVTTIVIRSEPANPPVALTRNWTDPGERDLRRAKAVFTYMGGMNMLGCEADSYTELKRAPRRFRAKRRFDSDDADKAFYRDLESQHYKAAEQMADYAAIFFKKYPNSAEFLAIIGSGPFWRYAVVNRTDCPWPEPGQRLPKEQKITKMDTFFSLFGSEYFEIGTQRSDAEWHKVRQVYFMKEVD